MEVTTININITSWTCVTILWPCNYPMAMHYLFFIFLTKTLWRPSIRKEMCPVLWRVKDKCSYRYLSWGREEEDRGIKQTQLRGAQGLWGCTPVSLSLCASLSLASPSDSKSHSDPLHYSAALQLPFYKITQRERRDGTRWRSHQM